MTECCCLCREPEYKGERTNTPLEATDLPGTGWRCVDRYACSRRVRGIIDAHKTFARACSDE